MAATTGAIQFSQVHRVRVPAVGTAGNDSEVAIGRYTAVQGVFTVTAVNYIADTTLTGANTNSRTLTLFNRKGDGTGTTVVAQLAFTSGVNATQWIPKAITLSGTAANLDLAAGDVLSWQSLHVGTGITDPGGMVEVIATRD